jgi:2-phospho-L-lactate guanylyltransferase
MPTIVVPYRGDAKSRLPASIRAAVAVAMLGDVVAAALEVGRVVVVTDDASVVPRGAETLPDPGLGLGAAVVAGLAAVEDNVLVVNADLPCVRPRDLLTLLGALPEGGLAVVEAADGTTNALALVSPHLFAPLYGPGSAERFRARATRLGVPSATPLIPNLADDVDTLADLERLEGRLGARTTAALEELRAGLAR